MGLSTTELLEKLTTWIDNKTRKINGKPVAAVLIPLFDRDGTPFLLLTQRSANLSKHSGQISFPGGKVDPEDDDVISTALRETEEEIGLPPDSIQVLGLFHDFQTPYYEAVTPVVGYLHSLEYFINSPAEIEQIIEVPLLELMNPSIHRTEQREYGGKFYTIHFYDWTDHEGIHHNIWGATAGVIFHLLKLISP